jgi:hypothetical protein
MKKTLVWLSFAMLMSLLAVTDLFLYTPRTEEVSNRLFKRDG